MWYKWLKNGIKGKCFTFIKNMYDGVKSMVSINGHSSEFFNCNVGVRQGENLSPLLFSLYINDLEEFLLSKNVQGLNINSSLSNTDENQRLLYLKLFILFYADDTVIISESAEGLQHALNEFHSYCIQWKLHVNVDKTKIMIFAKGRPLNKTFYFDNKVIEVVKEFKYLGIIFSRSGSFNRANKTFM